MKKKAAIIGATGFGGLGLMQIIANHPEFEITQLVARKDIGKKINEIFPSLDGIYNQTVIELDNLDYNNIDIAFLSTPDRAGMSIISKFYEKNINVIDFSGDFRFNNEQDYKIYAENKAMDSNHLSSNLLDKCCYGLVEKNKDKIKQSKIIGNPGCFAISMILGILPIIENDLAQEKTIICDGKSGVSGAGKNPGEMNFLSQRNENVNTYREGSHQHLVEVENNINILSKKNHKLLFVPQVVPMSRGILSTIYIDPKKSVNNEDLYEIFDEYYKNDPFVKITSKSPGTAEVRGTNFCKIRPLYDERTNKIIIISVIDNLMKGQSGNAVQIANILFGFDEKTGLNSPPLYP